MVDAVAVSELGSSSSSHDYLHCGADDAPSVSRGMKVEASRCGPRLMMEVAFMDYEHIKTEVAEIAKIAASVPEPFRDKCFELLLSRLLGAAEPGSGEKFLDATQHDSHDDDGKSPLPIQSQLRVFMNKTGVTRQELEAVVMFEEAEAHFIREPTPKNVAAGQIEWALLLALKSAVEHNKLETDPEDVRSICQDKGFYDKSNFSAIFKKATNAALFRQALEGQGEPQPLSTEGQAALAKLIKALAST